MEISAAAGTLSVEVGGMEEGAAAEVWIYGIARAVPVAVARGENRGRTIVYHNGVRRWLKLGDWRGSPAHWKVPLQDLSGGGVDAAAVIVQSGSASDPGDMRGAALLNLH
ncbi:MAG TPA: DUF1223 domain-containing protein [Xanthobacteraceae bacterium]|nr:DUF1223 domain-containing protein [Xanthobacteraceae bacterium]